MEKNSLTRAKRCAGISSGALQKLSTCNILHGPLPDDEFNSVWHISE